MMWAARNILLRQCSRSISILQTRLSKVCFNRGRALSSHVPVANDGTRFGLDGSARVIGSAESRQLSTLAGRSMRSKVEKRMRRETGTTLREIRRAKKLRKKLMTDEERLLYNLRRAKKKIALLLQKLKKYELPELPTPRHDPELLTPEQLQAYKKIGFRNRNYVPVGVRGVFGGVVQNMHLHWKFHETVQVFCDNFPKEKIKEMATMLARLSGGIVVNIHDVKTIIMFRGRNYRQPKNLIPINTLTKRKALFKARFEQALDSQKLNIKKIEQQLRRMGVNPEDPVAMASIQRVASTFFRAIDEKQGTPYVFHGDKQPVQRLGSEEISDAREEQEALSEDSDQEELDRFIAEIEDAADREFEEEEAKEKEEVSRMRYWNREEMIGRGRRDFGNGDSHSELGGRTKTRHGRRDFDSGYSEDEADGDVQYREDFETDSEDENRWKGKNCTTNKPRKDEIWESEDEISLASVDDDSDSMSDLSNSGDMDDWQMSGNRNDEKWGHVLTRSSEGNKGKENLDTSDEKLNVERKQFKGSRNNEFDYYSSDDEQ